MSKAMAVIVSSLPFYIRHTMSLQTNYLRKYLDSS